MPPRSVLAHLLRRVLRRRAAPLRVASLGASALVVAPHQDDETLGCGGLVAAKRRAGATVAIAFLTDGAGSHAHLMPPAELVRLRRGEAIAAAAELGVSAADVHFLDFGDGRLAEHADAVVAALCCLLRRELPDQVFAPCPWERWDDHNVANAIVRRALSETGSEADLYEYAIWFWDRWPWTATRLDPRLPQVGALLRGAVGIVRLLRELRMVVPVGDERAAKLRALGRHRSQTERLIDDPRWTTLAEQADGELLALWTAEHELFRPVGRVG